MKDKPNACPSLADATTLPLIDTPEVVRRTGIPERMVRRLVAERRIDFVKVGRHVRFRPEVVDAWLEANTIHAVNGRTARKSVA